MIISIAGWLLAFAQAGALARQKDVQTNTRGAAGLKQMWEDRFDRLEAYLKTLMDKEKT